MPKSKYEKLKRICKEKGIHVSEFINMAIDEKLNPSIKNKKWWEFFKA